MNKSKKIVIFITLLLFTTSCLSQSSDSNVSKPRIKQLIGIQLNPYLSENLFSGETVQSFVFAIRYGLIYQIGISFGPEFSGNYTKHPVFRAHSLNYGLYCRYTFLRKKPVSPFIELSGYYQTNKTTITDTSYINNGQEFFINNKLSYYVAPGISIRLVKNMFNIDILFKFSTDEFLNGKQFVPSIRFQYGF